MIGIRNTQIKDEVFTQAYEALGQTRILESQQVNFITAGSKVLEPRYKLSASF